MKKVNMGISDKYRKSLADGLSSLLADTYLLYLKTQYFHWNVKGPMFHPLHLLFEEQYQELNGAVDEIAERILALGHNAPGSFQQFSKLATLKEVTSVLPANKMIENLLHDHEVIINIVRDMASTFESYKDQGTVDLLTRRLLAHEKAAWMLRAQLS